ncbi:uncharacterized protein LOC143230662 isoform X2 [Tachypleus tridentatus]|uniref:uncharacterized protein LOC143230662 isoform X2 n=1 Tax=Tachypleus tridentatus TaxID=6853 RepID=UPI003FD47F68
MRNFKMAEPKIEATLAKTEEWSEFSDFQNSEDFENSNRDTEQTTAAIDNSFVDNFNDTFSNSLEDLVNTFDEKITNCFYNYEENVEKLAPVQVRTQDEIMSECQWNKHRVQFGLNISKVTPHTVLEEYIDDAKHSV